VKKLSFENLKRRNQNKEISFLFCQFLPISLQEQYTLWLFYFASLIKQLTRSCSVPSARLTLHRKYDCKEISLGLVPSGASSEARIETPRAPRVAIMVFSRNGFQQRLVFQKGCKAFVPFLYMIL